MALLAKWQFMDRSVTHKIVYGPQPRFGPYNILWVTSGSINCHVALSAMMNYLLIIEYQNKKHAFNWLNTLHVTFTNILKYWPASLTKTNRENKNVKYNIYIYIYIYTWHKFTDILYRSIRMSKLSMHKSMHLIGWTLSMWPSLFGDTDWVADVDRSKNRA
jgi:hypothetical protein